MVFSGDIGNLNQPIIRNVPETVADADYVMIESTYGDRLHDRPCPAGQAAGRLHPAHARPRRQSRHPVVRRPDARRRCSTISARSARKSSSPVTTASPSTWTAPMANEATAIYLQCGHECFDEETRALVDAGINPIWSDGIRISVSSEDSKAINENPEPKVILSGERHVRGGTYPSPSQAQSLAEGEHGALRRLSGGGNARPQAL